MQFNLAKIFASSSYKRPTVRGIPGYLENVISQED